MRNTPPKRRCCRRMPRRSSYRKSDRASRCLRLPVGCVDSSFRYSRMPGIDGSSIRIRCVSDERRKSRSMRWMDSSSQVRKMVRSYAQARPRRPVDRGAGWTFPTIRFALWHRVYSATSARIRTHHSSPTNAMRYSLVDLKLVVAVADAGNVSRGAAICFLAPSSASLRIRQLEESLGTPLFRRGARGVTLTRAGSVMLDHCRRCLAELEQRSHRSCPTTWASSCEPIRTSGCRWRSA